MCKEDTNIETAISDYPTLVVSNQEFTLMLNVITYSAGRIARIFETGGKLAREARFEKTGFPDQDARRSDGGHQRMQDLS